MSPVEGQTGTQRGLAGLEHPEGKLRGPFMEGVSGPISLDGRDAKADIYKVNSARAPGCPPSPPPLEPQWLSQDLQGPPEAKRRNPTPRYPVLP